MARPLKTGLDYFPLDVHFDDKIDLIEAEHGLIGFALLIKLWQKIYANGYFLEWNEDSQLLFAKRNNINPEVINNLLITCFKRDIFSLALYEQFKVLTSQAIQKRYVLACKSSKRATQGVNQALTLLEKSFTPDLTEFTPEETQLTPVKSAQSKLNESKVNETKVNDENFCERDELLSFNLFLKTYGKSTGDIQSAKSEYEKLTPPQKAAAINFISYYAKTEPDLRFRKNPLNYILSKYWEVNQTQINYSKTNSNENTAQTPISRSQVKSSGGYGY